MDETPPSTATKVEDTRQFLVLFSLQQSLFVAGDKAATESYNMYLPVSVRWLLGL